MKKVILAMAGLAVAASASAQRCDAGIFMLVGLSPSFYSVHVNGDIAMVVSLSQTTSTGIPISAPGVGTARPNVLSTWSYASGAFDGAQYNLTGETFYGACSWTGTAACDGSGGAVVSVSGLSQTVAGRSWGVNCGAIPLSTQSMRKIF